MQRPNATGAFLPPPSTRPLQRLYSRLVVNHPLVLVVVNIALAFVLGPLTVITVGLPNFSDPQLGFEPRNSKITIWEKTSANVYGRLVNRTLAYYPINYAGFDWNATTVASRKKRFVANSTSSLQMCVNKALSRVSKSDSIFVVESKTGANLFTASHLHSICRLQDAISSYPWPGKECYLMSLPTYVTALVNKRSCYDLDDDDVRSVLGLLQRCSVYYFGGELQPYCHLKGKCPSVPAECGRLNAVYPMLHILTDVGFLKDGNAFLTKVELSAIGLPHGWYRDDDRLLLDYYLDAFDGRVVEDGDVVVSAIGMSIVDELFNKYVRQDVLLFGMAVAMVVVVLLVYLRSFVLMAAVVGNVLITLCLSYFLYHYVVRLRFFPFINLIAALLLIAVSADDVFIVYDLWQNELRLRPDGPLERVMSETLRKAGLSVFVTSLTTAASVLANLANRITAISCFGVFAAVCILLNFVLMITWIPALIILIEKVYGRCVPKDGCSRLRAFSGRLSRMSDYFWRVIVFKIITVGSPFTVVALVIVGVLGLVAVFAKPGLRFPETNYLSVFASSNPLERYLAEYERRLRFANDADVEDVIEMVFLWGVEPMDDVDAWDPTDRGTLRFSPVDVHTPEVTAWQNGFCQRLRQQPFVRDEHRTDHCYFEAVDSLLAGPCKVKPENGSAGREYDLTPCCEMKAPNRTVRELCMVHYTNVSAGYVGRLLGGKVLGEVILDANHTIRIFSYTFKSTATLTPNFRAMDDFYAQVERFAADELADAPAVLRGGWFASYVGTELLFYDVQKEISRGTVKGIGLSLACSFAVLLGTSLNVIIAFYAIVTISLIIGATVGSLVFLGWKLSVTESLAITMSLGLAVDFTIHYGVTYLLAGGGSRTERVRHTVGTVCSAVSMAALTTFVSGASVLGARVLAYRQFGTFLVFVMIYSWLFSTFFFLPLCGVVGPLGNTGSVAYLFRRCCRRDRGRARRDGSASEPSTTRSTDASGRPSHISGAVSADAPYERWTAGLGPVYFQRPLASGSPALFDRSSLDSKLMTNSSLVFDARAARRAEGADAQSPHGRAAITGSDTRLHNGYISRYGYGYDDEQDTSSAGRDAYWKIKRPKIIER